MTERQPTETFVEFTKRTDAYNQIVSSALLGARVAHTWADQMDTANAQMWVVNGTTWTAQTLGLTENEQTEILSLQARNVLISDVIKKIADPSLTPSDFEALDADIRLAIGG